MRVAVHGVRRASVVLALCMIVNTADPLAQSEPSSGSDSPFTVVPVVNAPFVAEAVTTVLPMSDGSRGATQTLSDRYYRDSAGRVRAERRTPKGDLIIIDADPGDNGVTLLNSKSETFVRVPMALAQTHFHIGSNIALPRMISNRGIMGGTLVAYEVSPDLGLIVYARRLHPSFGTVEFRLTDIRRLEPAPELFEVPTSYLPAPVGTKFDLALPEW
jgi:hypothetical protein